ncbi:Cytosolic sulfotransferase 12 [Armadillidium vulgare]|nr:Cytosolic sulfotransferase 12 [Armadillidium vulgare]
MALKSGHTINPVIYEESVKQYEQFGGNRVGTIRLEPDGWFFTSPFIRHANKVYDFKFKPTDIVIMTFPKCGTTWTQEIVWTMVYNPNLDNPKRFLPGIARCPFMECDFLMKNLTKPFFGEGSFLHDAFVQANPDRNPDDGIFIQLAELTEDPRMIKTHLPFSLLSPSLAENSKLISLIHLTLLLPVVYSPFWKHVKEAWKLRNKPNVHFIFYEDLKADPRSEILRLQKFLDLNLTDSQINNIIHYTSFDVMKEREEKNMVGSEMELAEFSNLEVQQKDGGFFRKGISGDYKNKLSTEDIEKINKWTKENTQEMEIDFKYKIRNVELIKHLFDKK